MYNIWLISVIIWCKIRYSVSTDTDTALNLSPVGSRSNELTEVPSKTVTMNGHHNYYATQQIFYIYGHQQMKVTNNDTKGRDDYSFTPGMGAHKLHVRKLTWNEARKLCISEGAHLAVINSNLEETLLIQMLNKNNVHKAWLGIHDIFEEGDWLTVLDEPLGATGYSKWTTLIPNEPDNYLGIQNCGLLMKEGGMDDLQCSSKEAFFCEIRSD